MEELRVKIVEVAQKKEQPQGNDYIQVISRNKQSKDSRMDYRKQHQCSTL